MSGAGPALDQAWAAAMGDRRFGPAPAATTAKVVTMARTAAPPPGLAAARIDQLKGTADG